MINRNESQLIAKELRNARQKRRRDVTYGVRVGSQDRLKVATARNLTARSKQD